MSLLTFITVTAALLGSAVIGGVFFAFSSFVMKALARLPATQGVAAMQSINVVVINAGFLCVFAGTAVLALVVAGLAWAAWGQPSSYFFLPAAICYLLGTFVVTALGNIPLNHQLAAVRAADPAAADVWRRYLHRWTRWNHVRTAGSVLAALLYLLGLAGGSLA